MLKKPFYVLTESYKFARLYPLSQKDLPEELKTSKHFKTFDKQIENSLSSVKTTLSSYYNT